MNIGRKPVNRKLRRPVKASTAYKNLVRGNAEKAIALDQIRLAAPVEVLPEMARWGFGAFRNQSLKLFPRRLSDLIVLTTPAPGDLLRDLVWCQTVLTSQEKAIRKFVGLKAQLEAALLAGDRSECFKTLDVIEQEYGYSFWLLATKIAILQIFDGIEAQKDFIASVKTIGARPDTNFVTYWWGVRAEEDTTFERYTQRLTRQIDRAQLNPVMGAYVGYLLLGIVPSDGEEQTLLSRANYLSLVDLYQVFSDLLVVSVTEERQTALTCSPICPRL